MPIRVLICDTLYFHAGYHHELIEHSPDGVEYLATDQVLYCPTEVFASGGGITSNVRLYPYKANPHAHEAYDNIPVFALHDPDHFDLIHSPNLPVIDDRPFVVDIENLLYPWTVTALEFDRMKSLQLPAVPNYQASKRLVPFLSNLKRDKCRKILVWSDYLKDQLLRLDHTESLHGKIDVLYPSVAPQDVHRDNRHRVRIMFCGSANSNKTYIRKGGDDVFRVFDELRRHYDVELTYVGYVPKDQRARLQDRSEVRVHMALTKNQLFEAYRESDIFFFPTRFDTFGMVLLEAMNFELPIVTTSGTQVPSTSDIIDDGVGGFLVGLTQRNLKDQWPAESRDEIEDAWVTPSIDLQTAIEKLALLIEDSTLRQRMGAHNKRQIVGGRFDVNVRNEKLRQIYRDALDS